jgi:branched-chain amino acid transport system substrate-binding protein
MPLSRRTLLTATAGLPLLRWTAACAAEPILAGVSGPLTGPLAQYGTQWKRGFDLALDGINRPDARDTGVKARPLAYDFQDSQSDPRQSVTVAEHLVANPQVIIEFGDFSSPASMAASPVYQRAGLVQFGFTNSHPDFTAGGDRMWSSAPSQAEEQPQLAAYAAQLGFKRPAVLHLNTDWGRVAKDAFLKAAPGLGMEVTTAISYLAAEPDFRPTLASARDSKPDGLVLLSYYPDAALICRQAKDAGLTFPVLAGTSTHSPAFIEQGGAGVEGVHVMTTFFPGDPRPEAQDFVRRYRAKYSQEPDSFSAGAYDAMVLFAALCDRYGTTRQTMQEGLLAIRDVPSVTYGKVAFDPRTRRVPDPAYRLLTVKGAKFAVWDGARATTG